MKSVPNRLALIPLILVAACNGAGNGAPGDTAENSPFSMIEPDDVVHFVGTEPFWGGEVRGSTFRYETPENTAAKSPNAPKGEEIAVTRFAGRNGLSFTGTLDDEDFVAAVTPGECSDGMSDRKYPFNAMLQVRGENRLGCAWTDEHPATGSKKP